MIKVDEGEVMRKRISEQNEYPSFDLYNEYYKIEMLVSEKKILGVYNKLGRFLNDYFTLEEYLEYICFNDWKLRGTFTTVSEMRTGLGIEKSSITRESITEDLVLDFLQYALNCLHRVNCSMRRDEKSLYSDDTVAVVIKNNAEMLVEKLNAKVIYDVKNQEYFILYNNMLAPVIAKNIPDIKDSIMEYLMIDNRKDIKRKSEILCTLYKSLEVVGDSFKGTTYKGLYDDTKMLFNKSGIRHNVDKDSVAITTFLEMDEETLESWYDRIYDMFLSCMEINRFLLIKPEIESIKRGILQ